MPPLSGFPWELENTGWPPESKVTDGVTGLRKKFDDILAVWIQHTNVTCRRSDDQTDAQRRAVKPDMQSTP